MVVCSPLLHCPIEILTQITSYLDMNSLCRLSVTCRSINKFSNSNVVWRPVMSCPLGQLAYAFKQRYEKHSDNSGTSRKRKFCDIEDHLEKSRKIVKSTMTFKEAVRATVVSGCKLCKYRLQDPIITPIFNRVLGLQQCLNCITEQVLTGQETVSLMVDYGINLNYIRYFLANSRAVIFCRFPPKLVKYYLAEDVYKYVNMLYP